MVYVHYGQYSNEKLKLLKNNIQKIYGIKLIEDNGTIESWYIENNEYNSIVFLINKLENNTIRGTYQNPELRKIYDKTIIVE